MYDICSSLGQRPNGTYERNDLVHIGVPSLNGGRAQPAPRLSNQQRRQLAPRLGGPLLTLALAGPIGLERLAQAISTMTKMNASSRIAITVKAASSSVM
jgi:hypothetical protein